MYAVQFTRKSRNAKVGEMPVSTTTSATCPTSCPLINQGCYAKAGPLGMLWRALSGTTAGETVKHGRGTLTSLTWSAFTNAVQALPIGTLWRHNQAGDLPGIGDAIDVVALASLVDANVGRKGFTYSHKPVTGFVGHALPNAKAIQDANAKGFTINLSANTLAEADSLTEANVGPVVVVLSADIKGNVKLKTPQGRPVAVCPATYIDKVSCASCGLCQRQDRKVIVGFPAHGASKRKASAIAMA